MKNTDKAKRITRRKFLSHSSAAVVAGASSLAFPSFIGRALAASTELKVQFPGDFGQLDPAFWQNSADLLMIENIFPKLIRFKPGTSLGWEPSAAETIEQVNPLQIKFKLKPGLMWSGKYGEVTTDDVKYSFERFLDKKLNPPNSTDWVSLKDVKIVDKYTGIINLKEPSAAIWWSVLPFSAGAIVCKKAVEAQGGKFTTNPGATAGPYDIASWAPGDRISLVAHENWGGPKPAYSKVTILLISDLKAAEVAFEAGQVDFAQVAVSSVPDLQKNMPKGAKLDVRPVWGYFWLGLNSVHPKLADIRVRQAIIKAVDVDGIIDGAYFSMGSRATGFVAPGLVGHRDIAMPKRDVAGATALLKEAGVSSLSLDIDVSNSPDEQTSAQIIQANLADVGITVNINVHDQGTFLNLSNEKGKELQLSLQRYTSPPDPAWSTQWFLSSQAGVWNWQWFQSEEFDRLHVAAIQELDPAKRGKMYERMQQLMDDSATFLWLLHPPVALIYRDTLAPALLSNGDLDFRDFKPAG